MRRTTVTLTTGAGGAGTVDTAFPISGRIHEIRYAGTALNNGGSADYTITRKDDGGAVLTVTNGDGPWQYAPRQNVYTTATAITSAGTAAGYIPVDGYVRVVVAQAAASKTDTITIYTDEV